MMPNAKDEKKLYIRLLSDIAIKRGTSPTHANHPMLYLGNVKNSKTPDKTGAKSKYTKLNIFFFNAFFSPLRFFEFRSLVIIYSALTTITVISSCWSTLPENVLTSYRIFFKSNSAVIDFDLLTMSNKRSKLKISFCAFMASTMPSV